MDVVGALQTSRSAVLMFEAIQIQMNTVNEFLEGAVILAGALGETNPRVQAMMHENEHTKDVKKAVDALRVELELRVVQLEFANGKYGN